MGPSCRGSWDTRLGFRSGISGQMWGQAALVPVPTSTFHKLLIRRCPRSQAMATGPSLPPTKLRNEASGARNVVWLGLPLLLAGGHQIGSFVA